MSNAIVGALIGVAGILIGLVSDRFIQRLGKLRYVISDFSWDESEDLPRYTFYIKVFNEQEVDTGVRDVDVKFCRGGAEVISDRPKDTEEGYHADYLNFPSRQWVVKKLEAGDIRDKPGEIIKAKECDTARLMVRLPGDNVSTLNIPMQGGEEVEQTIGGAQAWWWALVAQVIWRLQMPRNMRRVLRAAVAEAGGVSGVRVHRDEVMRRTKIYDLEAFRTIANQLGERTLISEGIDDWRTFVVTPKGIEETAPYSGDA
jgi:hypothetical protein